MGPRLRRGHHRGSRQRPTRYAQSHEGVPEPQPLPINLFPTPWSGVKAQDSVSRSTPRRKGGDAPKATVTDSVKVKDTAQAPEPQSFSAEAHIAPQELSATKGYSAPKAPVKDSVNFKDSAQAP